MKMIHYNYAKAPYFKDVVNLLQVIINFDKLNLSLFITNSIRIILNYLNIHTNITLSSSLDKDNSLKGKDKILNICKLLNADEYYNAIGGKTLYVKEEFTKNGISLYFLKPNLTPYKQFKNDFVAGLSIIDVMMFNPPENIRKMLDNYELV
jgi:hypothetical protein